MNDSDLEQRLADFRAQFGTVAKIVLNSLHCTFFALMKLHTGPVLALSHGAREICSGHMPNEKYAKLTAILWSNRYPIVKTAS